MFKKLFINLKKPSEPNFDLNCKPMAVNDIQKETFHKLLDQIRTQVHHLKKKNKELNRENLKLRSKLEELQDDQADIFSNISESERLAMKHHVADLIEKIDKYLDE